LEALGINFGYLLVQIFNFAILFVILRKWVYGPIVDLLEKRRKTIADGIEDARVAAEARANAEKEAETVIAKAQQEASQQVRNATERAEEASKGIKAEAEKDAALIRRKASADAELTRDQALSELRGQVAVLAIAAAQKLIGEALDEKRQHTLIEEFFSGVKAGKVTILKNEALEGLDAEVTSALPLTNEEQEAVRADVVNKMGSDAEINFRVDPGILGGLVIRVGDKVVDGSVSGKLQGLRQSLV